MKRLSVVIVTYQSEADIYDCLEALWLHCDLPHEELEVIIVDNSPRQEPMFTQLRRRYGDDILLLHNDHNGGYGQGNNVGIRRATAPVVMIMNPDVRLYEPVMKAAVEAFENDGRLAMLGMKQMFTPTQPSPYSFICTYMMNGYLQTLLTVVGNRLDRYWQRYMYFSGSCFFVSKAQFEAVGLFDESVFMYGEEDDIHYRLLHHSPDVRMKYCPQLHYIHPMHLRKPDIDYERRLIDVAILQNEKKGYARRKTIRNRLRNVNLLLLRARLAGADAEQTAVLRQRKEYLKKLIKDDRS